MGTFMLIIESALLLGILFVDINEGILIGLVMFAVLAGIFYSVAFINYIKIKKRSSEHKQYLLRLPQGEIPIHKRTVRSRRKYVPTNRSSIEHKYPTPKDYNLIGKWDEIVLSKDEWQKRCKEESSILLALSILSILGAISINGMMIFVLKAICAEGLFLILFAVIFPIAWIYERRKGKKDLARHVSVNLKTVGIKRAHDLMVALLSNYSTNYTNEIIKPNWHIQYNIPGRIKIKLFYKENSSAYHQQGNKRIEIHYDSSNFQIARNLQIAMDRYFAQNDMIYRSDEKCII
jgi:hypothetical protein